MNAQLNPAPWKWTLEERTEFQEVMQQAMDGETKRIASELGITPQRISNTLNPRQGEVLHFDLIFNILRQAPNPDAAILWFCRKFSFQAIRLKPKDGKGGNLYQALASIAKELGDVAETLNEAMADGKLDTNERRQMAKEILELAVAVQGMAAQLDEEP